MLIPSCNIETQPLPTGATLCAVFAELHVLECEWPKINAVKH